LLLSYVDVKQVDIPQAQDVCFPWMQNCSNDNDLSSTGTAASGNTVYSVEVCAVRIPYSATVVPAMDMEIYSNYTCVPLPAYQKFLPAKIQAVDEGAYIRARRLIGLSGKSAPCIEPTAKMGSMFAEAAKALGKDVLAYVGKRAPKFNESGATMVGNLFENLTIHKLMLMCHPDAEVAQTLKNLRKRKVLPERMLNLIEELFSYTINFTDTAVLAQFPGQDDFVVEEIVNTGPFGSSVALRHSTQPCSRDDDDEKTDSLVDCRDALDVALKKPRTSSLPPVSRNK